MTVKLVTHRKSTLKAFLPVILIIALSITALFIIRSQLHTPKQSQENAVEFAVGAKLPDFTLGVFQGKLVQFSSLKGKIFLINFWATWCDACVKEIPSIIKLYETYKKLGFEILMVDLDDKPEKVLPSAIVDFGFTGPVYLDPNSTLSDLFDVHAIPLTVILSKDREVLLIESGERNWNRSDVRSLVEGWLSKK